MKSGILKNIVTALIVTLAVSGIGTCLALRTLTLVDTWIVAAIAVCAAFPLTAALTRNSNLFNFSKKSLRLAIWQIIVTSLLCGAFYGVNYAGADEDHTTTADATVERRYYKERQRTRRVGRGRYVATGEKYKLHYADIRIADGHLETIQLTQSQTNSIRNGQTLEVSIAKGLLGVPVVLRNSILKHHSTI